VRRAEPAHLDAIIGIIDEAARWQRLDHQPCSASILRAGRLRPARLPGGRRLPL